MVTNCTLNNLQVVEEGVGDGGGLLGVSHGVCDLGGGDLRGVGGVGQWDGSGVVPDGLGVLLDQVGGLGVGYDGLIEWNAEGAGVDKAGVS